MSWFPHFLSPLTAILAALVAIPALLVLYFLKLRRREVDIASTFLWKKAIQDLQVNAPFQKLRRNLLLLLQLLLLILLCLALSRPVSNYTPGAGKTSVILIDRSGSMAAKDMNGHSRLDEAKKRAKDLIGTMDRNASATVIAFDDQAETIQAFTTDTQALRNAVDSIEQTDRPSKLKLAYQLAQAQIAFIPEQLRPGGAQLPDVRLFSDGRVTDAKDVTLRANLFYDKIGTDQAGNIAIVTLSAKRNYEKPTQVQVFARLANYGPKPVTSQVQLSVTTLDENGKATDNAVKSVADVSLAPDRWTDERWLREHPNEKDDSFVAKDSVEFALDLTTAAVIRVEQTNKDGDLLRADDTAGVVVPPPKSLSVLLVTDGGASGHFFENLIESLPVQSPKVISSSNYEQQVPTDFDVIFFDNYSPKKLPPSGNFVCINSVPEGLKIKPVIENGQPVIMDGATVLDWKRDHPMMRYLSLRKVQSEHQMKLDVPPEDEVLIEGMLGPMMVLHREGRSMFLIVPFDVVNGNWPIRPSFPAFWVGAVQFMAVGADLDVKQSYDPGSTPRIPRTNLQKVDVNLKSIRLNGPMGSRELAIPPSGDFVLPALNLVGLYRTEPPVPQYERLAVNLLDPNESNLLPIESPPGGIVGEASTVSGKKSRLDLWWWIVACGALPLLIIEWWVYTRRVHL